MSKYVIGDWWSVSNDPINRQVHHESYYSRQQDHQQSRDWPGTKYSSFCKHWLKEGHSDQQHGRWHGGLVVQQLHRVYLQFMLFGSYPLKFRKENKLGRKKIVVLNKEKMQLWPQTREWGAGLREEERPKISKINNIYVYLVSSLDKRSFLYSMSDHWFSSYY